MNSPTSSLSGAGVATLLGVLLAVAGSVGGLRLGPLAVFSWCVLVAYALNWLAWVPAYLARTERFYDLTGSLSYLAVTAVALVWGRGDAVSVVLAVMVGLWTVRLGSFLVTRILADGKDQRFDEIKTDPARFLMTWTMQGLWVALTAGAALAAMTTERSTAPSVWTFVGAAVWFAGFSIEATADQQKRSFRSDPDNEGRFISSGLWSWSRHPNYFGEITLWVGVAIVAAPALRGWQLVTLISPLFVTVLITKISGVPMLEASGKKRWGDDPDYQRYVERTPVLVPRPPTR